MSRDDGKAEALHLATYSGWYRFEQRDQQWVQTDKALTFWKMSSLQVDPESPRHIYIATEHSGLFITANGGTDWQRAKPNVPRLTTTSLLALPGTIFAGTVPAALYCASNGSGWQELEGVRRGATGGSFPPSPELGARTRFLAADNETPRRLYAAIEVGGLLVSDDNGQHWSAATDGLDDPDVHQILPAVKTKGLVVAACGEGAYRSTDRGEHWENVTPPGNAHFRLLGNRRQQWNGLSRRWLSAARTPGSAKTALTPRYLSATMAAAHWDIAVERLPGGYHGHVPRFRRARGIRLDIGR